MCGIAGIISLREKIDRSLLKQMTDAIIHRGPDGDGFWFNQNHTAGLGHRRLSIIDLTHQADQPMEYNGRYVIVFNGEIYNYLEIKEFLVKKGYVFKTTSDTEVLIALFHEKREKCLEDLDGMFAFVIYDKADNTVFFARDRFGEKPLYYSFYKNQLFFGSEMKALWAGGVPKQVNNKMLFNYLVNGTIKNPQDIKETFYENIFLFPHSHYATYKVSESEFNFTQYFDIDVNNIDYKITEEEAQKNFRELMLESVKLRLRSDVPVGSSLSGGLDSSLIVCIIDDLIKETAQKQKTFSARFPGFKKDEGKYMQFVIDKTNAEPHFVYPDSEGLTKDFDDLWNHQEEPFGSASIYAQYSVMKLAKENNVTVLLDGQGADEILAGYHPYYQKYFNELKKSNKTLLNKEKNYYTERYCDSEINRIESRNPFIEFVKSHAAPAVNPLKRLRETYRQTKLQRFNPDFYNEFKTQSFSLKNNSKKLNEALYHSTFGGTEIQDLLRYADRNSMAHSREVRLPFLSHHLVKFLFTLPPHFKIRDGWTKWIMRKTFDYLLPGEISWRKDKIGYEPPQSQWLEDKKTKEQFINTQKELVNRKILTGNYVENLSSPKNFDSGKMWTYWMAGKLFEKE